MVFIETPRAGISRLFAVAEIAGSKPGERFPNRNKLESWACFLGIDTPPKTDKARLYYEMDEATFEMARDTEQGVVVDHAMTDFFLRMDTVFDVRLCENASDLESCLAS